METFKQTINEKIEFLNIMLLNKQIELANKLGFGVYTLGTLNNILNRIIAEKEGLKLEFHPTLEKIVYDSYIERLNKIETDISILEIHPNDKAL